MAVGSTFKEEIGGKSTATQNNDKEKLCPICRGRIDVRLLCTNIISTFENANKTDALLRKYTLPKLDKLDKFFLIEEIKKILYDLTS